MRLGITRTNEGHSLRSGSFIRFECGSFNSQKLQRTPRLSFFLSLQLYHFTQWSTVTSMTPLERKHTPSFFVILWLHAVKYKSQWHKGVVLPSHKPGPLLLPPSSSAPIRLLARFVRFTFPRSALVHTVSGFCESCFANSKQLGTWAFASPHILIRAVDARIELNEALFWVSRRSNRVTN